MSDPVPGPCCMFCVCPLNVVDIGECELSYDSEDVLRRGRQQELGRGEPIQEGLGEVIEAAREVPMMFENQIDLTVILQDAEEQQWEGPGLHHHEFCQHCRRSGARAEYVTCS